MERKTLSGLEIKNADRGEVSAVFASFDTVDHDGDIVKRSAFTEGQTVLISAYNHGSWQGSLPVGKGTVRTTDGEAVLDGQFFMKTTHGRETFETIKELGDLQEYSWGFNVTAASHKDLDGGDRARVIEKVDLFEVSPVLKGASIGTRTLAVKSDGQADDEEKRNARRRRRDDEDEDEKDPRRRRQDDEDDPEDEEAEGQDGDREDDDDEDEDEKDPRRRRRRNGKDRTLTEEISAAVDAVAAAMKSAVLVDAIRAERGKTLSRAAQDSLDELWSRLDELKAMLTRDETEQRSDVDTEEPERGDSGHVAELQREWLRSVAAQLP